MFRGGHQLFQVGQAPSGLPVIRPLVWKRPELPQRVCGVLELSKHVWTSCMNTVWCF